MSVVRFTKKVNKQKPVHFLYAKDANGLPTYFLVEVDSAKEGMFLKSLEKGNFLLTQFGKVLLSGYGIPPESVLSHIQSDFDLMAAGA